MQRLLRRPLLVLQSQFARRVAQLAAACSLALVAGCTALAPGFSLAPSTHAAATAAAAPAFSVELADARSRDAAFDQAWRLVDERFYDPGFNGVDWEAARLRYLPQLERVQSDAAFYALLGRMVGELRDSHTRIYNAHDYRNRLDYVVSTFGLRVAEVDGEVAITQVLPDTDAARAGLRPGMIVDAVDREPIRARLARLRAEAPTEASPERRLRAVYGRLLGGRAGEALTLEVRVAQGTAQFALKRAEREVPLALTHRVLDGNVGYIAFNRFRPETAAIFGRALGTLTDTDGLVLDLRGNPGGNIGAMLSIAQSFFPESRHVLTRRARAGGAPAPDGTSRPPARSGPPEMWISASSHPYTRPLAILIDGYSASAAELLATVLREQRGAWVVGRPSCGCVVAVRGTGYRLPGGGALYVAESGFVTPLGNRMEGAGMGPDREVPLTLSDLRDSVDRDLALARDWIRQRAQRVAEED